VTPLVDVVLVLLIIFMVLTPLLEKTLGIRVPDEQEVDAPDLPALQLVVSLDAMGEMKINSDPVSADDYILRLQRVLAARSAADRLVFFMADEHTLYASLVKAVDGARQAGASTIGMMTEPMAVMAPPSP